MPRPSSPGSDDPSRQKRVGEALRLETRNRLLDAAETEFTAHGYAATTVAKLAAAAGVSVQTLYLTWGSKRALLRGYMERALSGNATSPAEAAARFSVDMPPRQLTAELATLVTEIAERASTGWTLYRDAAAIDPEIAADWSDLQLRRHHLFTQVIDNIHDDDLACGLTRPIAIDTAWTIASPETFNLLVNRLDYTLDGFRSWLIRTLESVLLASE